MAKRMRLTEQQLKKVIQFIPENYQADDELVDVKLKPEDNSLVFTVQSGMGTAESELWMDEDEFVNKVEEELTAVGYDLRTDPKWDVMDAKINGHLVVLDIAPMMKPDQTYQISIHSDYILNWLPDVGSDKEEYMTAPTTQELY